MNSVIYQLKYLQTVDAAATLVGPNYYVFLVYQGEAHLPLHCNQHMLRINKITPTTDRVILFRAVLT